MILLEHNERENKASFIELMLTVELILLLIRSQGKNNFKIELFKLRFFTIAVSDIVRKNWAKDMKMIRINHSDKIIFF
jgi:hypothetical protein